MTILRPVLRGTIACIAAWLLLCLAAGIFVADGAVHPGRSMLTQGDEAQASAFSAENLATLSSVQIVAADGATLRGWSIRPIANNGDVVILLHGQADNRRGMLGNAGMLLRHGFSVLLPDARAHGESGGRIATYGVMEADDLRRWYAWIEQSEAPHCVDGLGDSMGGAQLLQSISVEPGFCAVIAESPFATFDEAAYDRFGQFFNTGPWLGRTLFRPALMAGLVYVRLRYGVDLEQASPAKSVAATHVPVLLIHGLADTNLPPYHSEMIKDGNPAVDLWEPAGAEHCGASETAPAEYERRVIGWFEGHDRGRAHQVSAIDQAGH